MSMLKGITWHILDFLHSKFEKKKLIKNKMQIYVLIKYH